LESERPSLVNLKNLGYNILKSLDNETVGDIDFPELGSCFECGNDILMSPIISHVRTYFSQTLYQKKTFSWHSKCMFSPNCEKSVDILDQADALGIISNLPIPDSKVTSQSAGISSLSNLMGTFVLSLPAIQMGGIESTATQQLRSTLRCAKCSENLSLYLPPLGFLRIFPQI
jgi:hypothetical protein